MSEENSKLTNEMNDLKEKLDKVKGHNAELTKQNAEKNEQIAKLMDKNAKLMEEIGAMKAEKIKENDHTQQIVSNSDFQSMKRKLQEKSTDLEDKRAKLEGKCVPNWLIEVLKWIKRMEMVYSSMSTSSWTFRQLCWPKLHGNVQPYKVANLYFLGERNESKGIYQVKLERIERDIVKIIPIANISPPKYIAGFKGITINFFDGHVMQFVECILPKLDPISLYIGRIDIQICNSTKQFGQIHRFFEMLTKKATSISNENLFNFLRFNSNALDLIENLESIREVKLVNHWDIDLLIQWLIKSCPDKKPKLLPSIKHNGLKSIFIDKIKEQFIGSSTQTANFLMSFSSEDQVDYANFNMENERTGEVLSLYQNPSSTRPFVNANPPLLLNGNQIPLSSLLFSFFPPPSPQLLVRHPKGQEYLREDWEQKLLLRHLDNLPHVYIELAGIGEF